MDTCVDGIPVVMVEISSISVLYLYNRKILFVSS